MTRRTAKKVLKNPWSYRRAQVETALLKHPPLFRVMWREIEHGMTAGMRMFNRFLGADV